MKTYYYIFSRCRICFSQWSRKGFAVFSALSREITISTLAIHVCQCALLKSARKGVIITDAQCYQMASDVLDTENSNPGYLPVVLLARDENGGDGMNDLKYNFIKRVYPISKRWIYPFFIF